MSFLQLHIGGQERRAGWLIVDAEPRPEVDFVTSAIDLSFLNDGSVETIYASHVLEHFSYNLDNELQRTLTEWYRVLKPAGKLLVSVPDLQRLCQLYLNPEFSIDDRHEVMRLIYGGHMNKFDMHKVGFDFASLSRLLQTIGFQNCQPVDDFGLFDDCSRLRIRGQRISVNLSAWKPT